MREVERGKMFNGPSSINDDRPEKLDGGERFRVELRDGESRQKWVRANGIETTISKDYEQHKGNGDGDDDHGGPNSRRSAELEQRLLNANEPAQCNESPQTNLKLVPLASSITSNNGRMEATATQIIDQQRHQFYLKNQFIHRCQLNSSEQTTTTISRMQTTSIKQLLRNTQDRDNADHKSLDIRAEQSRRSESATSPPLSRSNQSQLALKMKQLSKSKCKQLSFVLLALLLKFLISDLLPKTAPGNLPASFIPGASAFWASTGNAQRFEAQPEREYLVLSGAEVRLRCLVRERQGECLWLRNGRAVGNIARKYKFERQPEDGDCSMLIKNASVQQDDGLWQCQVTPSELDQDTLQSREVKLIVLVAPEMPQIKNITIPTQQITNSNNQQFNLHRTGHNAPSPKLVLEEAKVKHVLCEIRGGNPEPRIEWILDGRNVTKEAQSTWFASQQQGASLGQARVSQSRLKLADVRRSMNGKNLTCVAIHQTGNQSASVELDVQYLPTVSVIQREYSIVEGSPLSISCQVDANPPPNLINWRLVNDNAQALHHQQQLQQQGASSLRTQAGPSTAAALSSASSSISLPTRPGPILEFERISRDLNQNVFECLAQNAYGISLPADVKLNVLYAPYLVNTSNSESVPVGSDAQLACIFDGNPEPEIKWFYTDPLSRLAAASQLSEPNSQSSSTANAHPNQLQSTTKHNPQSASKSQQFLNIKNVTYRNEGDYHCEARNQINGVYYGVRSSNIILDVFGEPQFLIKSPVIARAVRGSKSDVSATFCSDPAPNKVFWQFGSIRLDVRLNLTLQSASDAMQQQQQQSSRPSIASLLFSQLGGGSASTSTTTTTTGGSGAGQGSPSSGPSQQKATNQQQQQQINSAQAAISQRFQVHPLQPLQRRDSAFSKSQTCFEAKLSLLEPELTDERDYILTVQNERGHQSATVRLQVSSPLSPMLIISSGLFTICAVFLISIVLLFVFRTRQAAMFFARGANGQNGAPANGPDGPVNGETLQNGKRSSLSKKSNKSKMNGNQNLKQTIISNSSVEHLANGNGLGNGLNGYHAQDQERSDGNINGIGEITGQTNGIVNGIGSGHANQASNLNSLHHHSNISFMSSSDDRLSIGDNVGSHQKNSLLMEDHLHPEKQHKQQQQQDNGKQQHTSMSSSSEISSHASASDQRQLLSANECISSPGAVNCGAVNQGMSSPGILSIGSQISSAGSSRSGDTTLDTHTNIDFNLQTSTLASSNSISSAASSTILRSTYNNKNIDNANCQLEQQQQQQVEMNNKNNNNHVTNDCDERSNYGMGGMIDLNCNNDENQDENQGATYRAAESVLRGVSNLSGPMHSSMAMMQQQNNSQNYNDKNTIIYANIDNSHQAALSNLMNGGITGPPSSFGTPNHSLINQAEKQQTPSNDHQQQQQFQLSSTRVRSKVGATIAMMNSLAAQSNVTGPNSINGGQASTTSVGALNGAMRQISNLQKQQQQQHQNALPSLNRKQGPPKPPKPMIQQASRFYQQAAAAVSGSPGLPPGVRMSTPTREELAVEYSRLAFPERAEL